MNLKISIVIYRAYISQLKNVITTDQLNCSKILFASLQSENFSIFCFKIKDFLEVFVFKDHLKFLVSV